MNRVGPGTADIIEPSLNRNVTKMEKKLPFLLARKRYLFEPKGLNLVVDERWVYITEDSDEDKNALNKVSIPIASGSAHKGILQSKRVPGDGICSSGPGTLNCSVSKNVNTENTTKSGLQNLERNCITSEQQKSEICCNETGAKSDYGWNIDHRVFGLDEEDPLKACNILGHGALGIVEEVRCANTQLPTFVRKRVKLPARKTQAQATLKMIQEEAKNLRSLEHPHIVTFLGSYEEMQQNSRHFYHLLMCPVGDNDLRSFLDIVGEQIEQNPDATIVKQWTGWIRSWLVCLTSALAHMHDKGIRHQDIKPSNVIHKGPRVYFTDFSSSCAFEIGHTTSTENPSRSSPMYAAPEVTDKYDGSLKRHGRASDIFALACVFCDMMTVMTHRTVSSFHEFLVNDDSVNHIGPHHGKGPLYYSRKVESICRWFKEEPGFPRHIHPLLVADRTLRPTALEVLQRFALDLPSNVDCRCFEDILPYRSSKMLDIPCMDGPMLRLTLSV